MPNGVWLSLSTVDSNKVLYFPFFTIFICFLVTSIFSYLYKYIELCGRNSFFNPLGRNGINLSLTLQAFRWDTRLGFTKQLATVGVNLTRGVWLSSYTN
jgi:hypothetical protein